VLPLNYTPIVQNGDWVSAMNAGKAGYSFSTSNGPMLGSSYFGYSTSLFPQIMSTLGNGNVACAAPYNSVLSFASTLLYVTPASNPKVSIEADGAMEVYYALVQPNQPNANAIWQKAFGGTAWKQQAPTAYGPTQLTLGKGLYYLVVAWSNGCGAGGQAFSINSLPTT